MQHQAIETPYTLADEARTILDNCSKIRAAKCALVDGYTVAQWRAAAQGYLDNAADGFGDDPGVQAELLEMLELDASEYTRPAESYIPAIGGVA